MLNTVHEYARNTEFLLKEQMVIANIQTPGLDYTPLKVMGTGLTLLSIGERRGRGVENVTCTESPGFESHYDHRWLFAI